MGPVQPSAAATWAQPRLLPLSSEAFLKQVFRGYPALSTPGFLNPEGTAHTWNKWWSATAGPSALVLKPEKNALQLQRVCDFWDKSQVLESLAKRALFCVPDRCLSTYTQSLHPFLKCWIFPRISETANSLAGGTRNSEKQICVSWSLCLELPFCIPCNTVWGGQKLVSFLFSQE